MRDALATLDELKRLTSELESGANDDPANGTTEWKIALLDRRIRILTYGIGEILRMLAEQAQVKP